MDFIGSESSDEIAAPNSVVEEKLLLRMKQRTEELAQRSEKRRNEQTNRNTGNESADAFLASFNEMKDKLEEDLATIDEANDDKEAVMEKFDKIVREHGLIQHFLNESQVFLPAYCIKRSQELLVDLYLEIQKKMEATKPQKRFGFRNKDKPVTKPPSTLPKAVDTTDSSTKNSILDKILKDNFFGFTDKTNETLVMKSEEIASRQLNLQNLTNCTVQVLGTPSTIQVSSLTNCTVLIGPTMRSAFIKQCSDCTFVMACQQVRIHDTKDTEFYLHVTGAAIIESCEKVGFAPYNLEYPELDEHFTASGLDRRTNYWDKVEDFKWINEKESSPNMYLIEASKRRTNWL